MPSPWLLPRHMPPCSAEAQRASSCAREGGAAKGRVPSSDGAATGQVEPYCMRWALHSQARLAQDFRLHNSAMSQGAAL